MRRVFFGVYGIKLVRNTVPIDNKTQREEFFRKTCKKTASFRIYMAGNQNLHFHSGGDQEAAEQMNGKKKTLFVVFGVIILLAAVVGIYAVSRRVAFNNNEILLSFEQYNPEVYTSEYSGITYYEYECDNGRVICQYEPIVVTAVRDDRRGAA